MPAGLPGSSTAQNAANPSAGPFVIFSPFSGPKGSPLDKPGSAVCSTGGLSTGIGFGAVNIAPIAPASIKAAGFNDDYTPGLTLPNGSVATTSILVAIGGGKSDKNGLPVPYTAGFALLGAGQGGSRDGGAGPAFTGFSMKTVTAAASTINGAAVETGFVNRTGATMSSGQSTFGSNATASAAIA
jgi:hypothetical protein